MTRPLTLKVNGRTQEFVGSPMTRLLDVIRETLRLTGTKEGCGEGECGSCTVLMDGDPVCACLVPVFQAVGREIVTVEHLAQQSSCAPLIDGLVSEGGIQCGACTPGIVVTLAELLERVASPDRDDVCRALAGNLCRCTGYEGIHRAVCAATGAQRSSDAAASDGERDGEGDGEGSTS